MFRQPRHIGDAFRRRPWTLRRACGRCCVCSKAWPPVLPTATPGSPAAGCHPAAPGTGNGEWVGEPAQRPSRAQPGRQRRRRPRHLSPKARCAIAIRHRRARATGCTVRCIDPRRRPKSAPRWTRRLPPRHTEMGASPRSSCLRTCRGASRIPTVRPFNRHQKLCRPSPRAGDPGAHRAGIHEPRDCRETLPLDQNGRRAPVPR